MERNLRKTRVGKVVSNKMANYTSIFVIGVAVFTFFFPHTFDWVLLSAQQV